MVRKVLYDQCAVHAQASDRPASVRWKSLSVLWSYAARHIPFILLAGLALLAAVAATLAVPVAVRYVIDEEFSHGGDIAIAYPFLFLLLAAGLLALASAARFYCVSWLGERVICDIRTNILRHVLQLGPAFFDEVRTGRLVSSLTVDAAQVEKAIGTALSVALRNFFLLLGAVIMMVMTSPFLSILVIGIIPLIVLPVVAFGRAVKRRSRYAQELLADAVACASEAIETVRTIQAFNATQGVVERFSGSIGKAFEASRRAMWMRAVLTASLIFTVFSGIAAVLWYGSYDVLHGNMSGGALGQFVLYALLAAGAMGELSQVSGEILQASGAASRLSDLLEVQTGVRLPASPRLFPEPARGLVTFKNVSFAFPTSPEKEILRSISFSVRSWERVAIVGASGAGKSSLFHLLLRYYDPTGGEIAIDGVPIGEAALESVRARLAIVPQDTVIFAASVADNIRFGRSDASEEEIVEAARAASADSFIAMLPDGYKTQLGERGVTLSGGQRQRIAIARAILRDAPILLLDEATSALDAENETLVHQALLRLMGGRTTITIAHRLATIKEADRILVMDQGRIVEEGNHGQLITGSGLYAKWADMQFASNDDAGKGEA